MKEKMKKWWPFLLGGLGVLCVVLAIFLLNKPSSSFQFVGYWKLNDMRDTVHDKNESYTGILSPEYWEVKKDGTLLIYRTKDGVVDTIGFEYYKIDKQTISLSEKPFDKETATISVKWNWSTGTDRFTIREKNEEGTTRKTYRKVTKEQFLKEG